MSQFWSPEFEDEVSQTKYPFGDDATLISRDGGVAILIGMFVDASVYPLGGAAGLYLSSVVVADREVTLWFGSPTTPQLCSTLFDPLSPPAYLALSDLHGRAAGMLVCDPTAMSAAQTWAAGVHDFDAAASPVVASCTIPLPSLGISGFIVGDAVVSGDVWLVGEGGVVVREDNGAIRIDVVGDPLFARRLCETGGVFTPPRFVRTINGNPPDQYGDFKLEVGAGGVPDTILRITPAPPDAIRVEVIGRTVAAP